MSRTLTWLLCGAALTLTAGATAAAAQDSSSKAKEVEEQVERDVRVYRLDRDRDRDRDVRVFRFEHDDDDDDHHVFVRRAHGREHLKDILQLRPDQEPALKAFLEATKPESRKDHLVRFDRGADTKTTAERLNEMEAALNAQQASMRARIQATRTFYNQLDEKQKKAFDAMPMLMMAGPGFGPMMIPVGLPHPPPLPRIERFERRLERAPDA